MPSSAAQAEIADNYGKLPMSFEANQGQTDPQVKFLSRGSGYSLFLTGDEAVLALPGKNAGGKRRGANLLRTVGKMGVRRESPRPDAGAMRTGGVLRMKLRNANPAAKVEGADELPGTSNYFIGNDPAKWRTNVPTYAKVKYEGIYSGIDLVYYGNQRQLEYDFIVSPGANPSKIAFDIRGAKRIRRDQHGDLIFQMGEGKIRWQKPVVYQEKDGARQEIAASYAITDRNRVAFQLARYDADRPLFIDPLIYSTYLGSDLSKCVCNDPGANPLAIAVDRAGNAYVTGWTYSPEFPVTPGAFDTTGNGAFVTKFNQTGSALVYSTILGGAMAFSIAVDGAGDAYVTGRANSSYFPTTPGAFQTASANLNPFVTEINPAGSALVYSTYLGGSNSLLGSGDQGFGIAVDSTGSAYVTGITGATDFPVTSGAFQTTCNTVGICGDAFVAKLNSEGSALVYSTYLGGSDAGAFTAGVGIVVDSATNAYVTGWTYSLQFPVTPGAFQTTCVPYVTIPTSCGYNAFVTKLNPAGSALVYSTYLGSSSSTGQVIASSIAVDHAGNAYVTGSANSGFPVTPGAFQTTCCGAFVTKLNPTASALVYSTYLGGNAGTSIAIDRSGDAYVTGSTGKGFPLENPIQKTYGGGTSDAFAAKLNREGSALAYSTYLGGNGDDYGFGIALNRSHKAYIVGWTASANFPVTPGAFQTTYGVGSDAFVTELNIPAETTTTLSSSSNPSSYGESVKFVARVSSVVGAPPGGETVTFQQGSTVLGTGTLRRGTATFSDSMLTVGTRNIKAVYAGDANFVTSTSNSVSQIVSKATTTTALVSSQNPSSYEQPVTFTATVAPQFSGAPTGSVNFYNGTTFLKTVTLIGGTASYTTTKLAVGTGSVTAEYEGSTSFDTSTSAALSQTVNQASTTTTLASSLNPSNSGQSVTFTATVAGQFGGKVTGSVTFMDGSTILKTVNLSGGVAEYKTSTLPVGTDNITATYNGSTDFTPSAVSLTQTVN